MRTKPRPAMFDEPPPAQRCPSCHSPVLLFSERDGWICPICCPVAAMLIPRERPPLKPTPNPLLQPRAGGHVNLWAE